MPENRVQSKALDFRRFCDSSGYVGRAMSLIVLHTSDDASQTSPLENRDSLCAIALAEDRNNT